jgi:Dual specificity phosphatase, catalytic domain
VTASDIGAAPAGGTIIGVSRLDDYVLLADAGLAMAMAAAGAERLVDLRGETTPPRLPIPIDHFPLIDLEPGQDALILQAANHVAGLAATGITVGVYCQAGISRTSTVAIAYLLVNGVPLDEARDVVRAARPQAMPALSLWRSLEHIAAVLAGQGPAGQALADQGFAGQGLANQGLAGPHHAGGSHGA